MCAQYTFVTSHFIPRSYTCTGGVHVDTKCLHRELIDNTTVRYDMLDSLQLGCLRKGSYIKTSNIASGESYYSVYQC